MISLYAESLLNKSDPKYIAYDKEGFNEKFLPTRRERREWKPKPNRHLAESWYNMQTCRPPNLWRKYKEVIEKG